MNNQGFPPGIPGNINPGMNQMESMFLQQQQQQQMMMANQMLQNQMMPGSSMSMTGSMPVQSMMGGNMLGTMGNVGMMPNPQQMLMGGEMVPPTGSGFPAQIGMQMGNPITSSQQMDSVMQQFNSNFQKMAESGNMDMAVFKQQAGVSGGLSSQNTMLLDQSTSHQSSQIHKQVTSTSAPLKGILKNSSQSTNQSQSKSPLVDQATTSILKQQEPASPEAAVEMTASATSTMSSGVKQSSSEAKKQPSPDQEDIGLAEGQSSSTTGSLSAAMSAVAATIAALSKKVAENTPPSANTVTSSENTEKEPTEYAKKTESSTSTITPAQKVTQGQTIPTLVSSVRKVKEQSMKRKGEPSLENVIDKRPRFGTKLVISVFDFQLLCPRVQ